MTGGEGLPQDDRKRKAQNDSTEEHAMCRGAEVSASAQGDKQATSYIFCWLCAMIIGNIIWMCR